MQFSFRKESKFLSLPYLAAMIYIQPEKQLMLIDLSIEERKKENKKVVVESGLDPIIQALIPDPLMDIQKTIGL